MTSHLAADSLTRRTQEASALAVHKALQRGAAIDEQIAARVEARHPGKWSSQRLCTARGQLVKAGLAYDTGKLATTRRGRNAIVWALNPASEQVPLFEMGDGL